MKTKIWKIKEGQAGDSNYLTTEEIKGLIVCMACYEVVTVCCFKDFSISLFVLRGLSGIINVVLHT